MGDPARAGDMDKILARFGEVQEEYDHLGGYALESQAREVLHGLGFDDERIDGDVGALSGGWKMRVAMARVLLGKPDVLLMDEPTNHLDIESIIWLESFLKSHEGALLMTSHDREFMNRIVSKICEIDGGEITVYSGNYDFYERERATREATAKPRMRASRRCSPRNSASSSASRRTPPRRAGAEPHQGARQDREDRAAQAPGRRQVRLP
jgi:ATPase subunit of ABC transporter with duplicated ATPase domains